MKGVPIAKKSDIEPNFILLTATCAALATLIPVAAHQLGILDHLPDIPGKLFDSDRITISEMAYPLGIPDSLLGLGSYGSTLVLIVWARKNPTMRGPLRLKLCADGSLAAFNTVRQMTSFRKLCMWCTGTALCTVVMLWASRGLATRTDRRIVRGDIKKLPV